MKRIPLSATYVYKGRSGPRGYALVDDAEAALTAQAFRDEHMPFAQPDPALVAALELRDAA